MRAPSRAARMRASLRASCSIVSRRRSSTGLNRLDRAEWATMAPTCASSWAMASAAMREYRSHSRARLPRSLFVLESVRRKHLRQRLLFDENHPHADVIVMRCGSKRTAERPTGTPSHRRRSNSRGGCASSRPCGSSALSPLRRVGRDRFRRAVWRGPSRGTTRRCCRACRAGPRRWPGICRRSRPFSVGPSSPPLYGLSSMFACLLRY